jgi:hypothetical protein
MEGPFVAGGDEWGTYTLPSFMGTQLTSWNFFAWTTNTSGNVANRKSLRVSFMSFRASPEAIRPTSEQ